MTIEIQLFGPFAVTDEKGRDLRPKLLKARAILAVLAVTRGHRHSRSWFQALLWQDRQHAQALSSMRSALTDIRRHLGPHAAALIADHSDVALDPAMIATDLENGTGDFLAGFDVPNASNFEDWLRSERSAHDERRSLVAATAHRASDQSARSPTRLYLASRRDAPETVTKMQCDTLVDCLAQSTEELGLTEVIDGRGQGQTLEDFRAAADRNGCGMILVAEAAEANGTAIARLKVVDAETAGLIWSKSVSGRQQIDLEDPATIALAAEFVDILCVRTARAFNWHDAENQPPHLLAASGVNHIFRLGLQNFETADLLFKRAHAQDRRGRHLAWRAFLRTFMLCEGEFGDRQTVIEEGTMLSRRALESEPHNSMVLALCAHVENMLHNSYRSAFDLSARALELNRCNPLAWGSLGVAASFLGDAEIGYKFSKIGAKMAAGSHFGYQADCWASSAGLLAGDLDGAKHHAEASHARAPSFAPPMRYLSALYCANGQFDQAQAMVDKLRAREPDFTLDHLRDDGYPTDSLRQARIVDHLPGRDI